MSLRAELSRTLRARGREAFRLEVDLDFGDEISVLVGESGAGKTTLLQCLLGATRPDRGRIALGERVLFDSVGGTDLPIERRGIGMIFQQTPIFPHLDPLGNVAIGIDRDRKRRAEEWLERVGAGDWRQRPSSTLSGGESQRIALARALASAPGALLLDEPFSALDRRGRAELGALLRELVREAAIPFVHVTHDLEEAVRLGDRLFLMSGGNLLQSGPPTEVLQTPESLEAAHAVGVENLFPGTLRAQDREGGYATVELAGGTRVRTAPLSGSPGDEVLLALRAQDVLVAGAPVSGTSALNALTGRVREITPLDRGVEILVDLPEPLRALLTPASVEQLSIRPGGTTHLLVKASAFRRLR